MPAAGAEDAAWEPRTCGEDADAAAAIITWGNGVDSTNTWVATNEVADCPPTVVDDTTTDDTTDDTTEDDATDEDSAFTISAGLASVGMALFINM